CLRCRAKDPTRRYPSAEALAEDLTRWLRGEPTKARPRRWPARVYRTARKHPVGVLLGVIILCIPVVLCLRDPDRAVRQFQEELAQGRPITLIGETGKPQWLRWRAGESESQVSLGADNSFSVHSWSVCLLELLPDPVHPSYRLSAKVRHDDSGPLPSGVGLFFAHRAHLRPSQADLHQFMQVSYNDCCTQVDVYRRLAQFNKNLKPPLDLVELASSFYGEGGEGWNVETKVFRPSS